MLYKLPIISGVIKDIEPMPYLDFADVGKLEKDLEELLAKHMLDVLFEDTPIMPIFQERARQAEADIYALNKDGDLIIFELKRGMAGPDAMLQALRYAQDAGQWTYNTLEEKYRIYSGNPLSSLSDEHNKSFNLQKTLQSGDFNKNQKLIVIGNAANDVLIEAVDFWKRKGLNVDFIPYRLYMINEQHYFEFFSIPYDKHYNSASSKGVLFDTNRSYNQNNIWEMMEKRRVSAYGTSNYFVDHLNQKDIVFYSHKNCGIVAAAEVIGPVKDDGIDEKYRDVKFLTPIPLRITGIQKFLPFSSVSAITRKDFYWARTIKVPYLSKSEALILLDKLNDKLK